MCAVHRFVGPDLVVIGDLLVDFGAEVRESTEQARKELFRPLKSPRCTRRACMVDNIGG